MNRSYWLSLSLHVAGKTQIVLGGRKVFLARLREDDSRLLPTVNHEEEKKERKKPSVRNTTVGKTGSIFTRHLPSPSSFTPFVRS